jgi:UDP:flavonoid glycosyltransferase YjiC (YdhE family)
MYRSHVAFFLDEAYGNIVPTLGISMELLRRGHKVTYIVAEGFSSLIRSAGATPVVVDLLDVRQAGIAAFLNDNDHQSYRMAEHEISVLWKQMCDKRTAHALPQLERMYHDRMPDIVVFDHVVEAVARAFACRASAKLIRLTTQFIEEDSIESFSGNEPILITVPKSFHRKLDQFEAAKKFKFVGFVPEGRCLPFRPWRPMTSSKPRILISPTTGLLKQVEFCRKIIGVFRDQPWDVVLSISGAHDKLSTIDAELLGDMPANIHINRDAGNFDILSNVQLFINQAGQGGALEAIYWGVPQILLPPTPFHYSVARRVAELGLGVCLPPAEMSGEMLIGLVTTLLRDQVTLRRVQEARNMIRQDAGAGAGADIIEEYL